MTEDHLENSKGPIVVASQLLIPASLIEFTEGAGNTHRDSSSQLISAGNDVEAVWEWLHEFEESPHTYRAYRKEAERFLIWSLTVRKSKLAELRRDDVGAYFRFASEPPPEWVQEKATPRTSPDWRPFRKPLDGTSLRQAKVILNAMLSWLVKARYIKGNPLSLIRKKSKRRKSKATVVSKERRQALSTEAVEIVREWLANQPADQPKQRLAAIRNTLIFELFYGTGGRRFEITQASMGKLSRDAGRWWLTVIGKGDKEADMVINDDLMDLISNYRCSYGLPPLPFPGEKNPLIMRLGGPTPLPEKAGLSDNMVYRLVKTILGGASSLALEKGAVHEATILEAASTHWLRHTTLTHAYDKTHDVRLVMDLGRHENINTSMKYVKVDRESLHDRVSKALRQAEQSDESD